MTDSSSFAAAGMALPSLLGLPISEKLSKNNLVLWKAQVLPAIRGAQLEGHLDGTTPAPQKETDVKIGDKISKSINPDYAKWVALDQQVLGYLLTTMTREVMAQVATATTAAGLWAAVEEVYSSQTRARSVNTRIALATLKKGSMTAAEYMSKMKALADDMAAAGKPLDDEEFVSYILTGLDAEFNPLVSAVIARPDQIGYSELLAQVLSYESRLDLQHGGGSFSHSSANSAFRGGRSTNRGNRGRGGFPGRGRGSNGNRGRGTGGHNGGQRSQRPLTRCQVCLKDGHSADRCWHRFDEDYVPDERNANIAIQSYGIDTNWYTDSGATDHITNDLDKLVVHDKYDGNEQIRTASGAGSGNQEDIVGRQM